MGENGSTVGTYVFRGIEYVVTVTVEDGRSLQVEVEDRMTADQWCGSFDVDYVEDLTHKTGNYKQFPIFVSMIESALTQRSDSVSLDLLTYADLESMRNRKGSSSAVPKQKPTLQSKRYLILTYVVEFDRIHYPLPLQYNGKPDPKVLQDTIRELRKEIKTLKSQGIHGPHTRNKEMEKLRREIHLLKQEKEEIQSEFDHFKAEVKHTSRGNSAKEIRILKNVVKNLEEDLLKDKSKHQRASNKRNTEYRKLQDEVDELKASERNLRVRVKSLTNELAVIRRGRPKSVNTSASSRKDSSNHSTKYRGRTSSQESISRSRDNSRNSIYSRDRSYSRERSRPRDRSASADRLRSSREHSWSHDRSHDRSRGSGSSYRSRGSNPSSAGCRNPRFDPTAFIKEKERKNKEAKYSSKRQARANISGGSNSGRKPSPYTSPFSDRSYGSRRPRSRPSSVGSLRSRTSSVESLSDIGINGFQSDASDGRWKQRRLPKSAIRTNAWSSPEVSYEKPVKDTNIQIKKVLSSTPDKNISRKKPVLSNKENIPSDAMESDCFLDRSSEITEIDTRLKRLQQYMKDHMP